MKVTMSPVYLAFEFGAAETTKTIKLPENGWAKAIHIKMPTFSNTVTGTLSIVDPCTLFDSTGGTSVTIFSSSAVSNGASYKVGDDLAAAEPGEVAVDKTFNATLTLSGVPGGSGGAVIVAMYLKH